MGEEGLMVGTDPRNSQGMTDWITDRLPTQADTDEDGDVEIPCRPDQEIIRWQHYSLVVPGQPWSSFKARASSRAVTGTAELSERAMTTHQLLSRLNDVNQELVRRVREGLI